MIDKKFTATLQKSPAKGGWTYVVMPGSAEFFGTKGSMTVARSGFQVYPDMKTDPENLIPVFQGHPGGGPTRSTVKPAGKSPRSRNASITLPTLRLDTLPVSSNSFLSRRKA